jgi:hypothetical protein
MRALCQILVIALLALSSCSKDEETFRYAGPYELEMVLNIEGEDWDTLHYFSSPIFSFQRIGNGNTLKYLFYQDKRLIRVFDVRESDNTNTVMDGNWKFENRFYYSATDSVTYSKIYLNNQRVLSDYYCLIDYPFEGINCFKLVAE